MPTPGLVGSGGSMPAWPMTRHHTNPNTKNKTFSAPPTALSKTGRAPAWPTQFVTSRYKVKVSHARSPKRPQLGSSTATMFQTKNIKGTDVIHTSGWEGKQNFEPQFLAKNAPWSVASLCRAGTTTPACPEMSQSHPNHNCRLSPCQQKGEWNLANTHKLEELSAHITQLVGLQRAPKPPTFQPLGGSIESSFSWKRGKRTLEWWLSSSKGWRRWARPSKFTWASFCVAAPRSVLEF